MKASSGTLGSLLQLREASKASRSDSPSSQRTSLAGDSVADQPPSHGRPPALSTRSRSDSGRDPGAASRVSDDVKTSVGGELQSLSKVSRTVLSPSLKC